MTAPITSQIPMLDHTARKRAEDNARARIAGDAPKKLVKPKLNYGTSAGKYPAWMKPLITSPIVVALVAMLVYSAIRIYDVGMKSAITSGLDGTSAVAMGLLTIIMAELGAVGLQLAEANDSFTRNQVYALRFGSWVCVAIAISGNAEAMQGHILDSVFTVLDTFAPPVLALILSMALKGQMLQAVADRHETKTTHEITCKRLDDEYKAAVDAHTARLLTAHTEDVWRQAYANACTSFLAQLLSSGQQRLLAMDQFAARKPDRHRPMLELLRLQFHQ